MKVQPIDIVVVVAYFVVTIAIGFYVSRRNKNADQYFLGGRSFPGWAIGLSFIGAMVSSVTFIALPADSFKTTWVRYMPNFAFPVVVLISAYLFVPFFRRGTVTSAYQYLGLRFSPVVSAYGAVVFLLAQIVRTASVVYLVAVLMTTLTGLSIGWSIIISGGVTAVYTVKGGFAAVVWTDVIQTLVLVLGALVCIAVLVWAIPGGLSTIFTDALAGHKFSLMDLNVRTGQLEPIASGVSFTEKTALMLFFVGFMQYLAGKLNQESVQRWCSSRTAHEARKSMLYLGVGSLPIWAAFMFIGTCLWVYYQHFPDPVAQEILEGKRKAEEILPHFILTGLPRGVAGILISAALAAAMSTLSAAINSASMVWVQDIYGAHLARGRDARHYLRVGQVASLVISLLMMGGAFLFHISSTKTLTDFSIIVIALLGGGISGTFLLGMLTRRVDSRAVIIGILATFLFTCYSLLAQFHIVPRIFDPYYTSIIGNFLTFFAGYLSAVLLGSKCQARENLTVWDLKANTEN